jgi:hypothetical protein
MCAAGRAGSVLATEIRGVPFLMTFSRPLLAVAIAIPLLAAVPLRADNDDKHHNTPE